MDSQRIEHLYIFLIEQIVKKYRQVALQAFREHEAGITVDQWIVLKQISENNGTSQVEIANSTVKDAPTTTRIIDQLTSKNLISKQQALYGFHHRKRTNPDQKIVTRRTRIPQDRHSGFFPGRTAHPPPST